MIGRWRDANQLEALESEIRFTKILGYPEPHQASRSFAIFWGFTKPNFSDDIY